jgi:hypothetical protein
MNAALLEILLNNQTPINLNLKKLVSHNNLANVFGAAFFVRAHLLPMLEILLNNKTSNPKANHPQHSNSNFSKMFFAATFFVKAHLLKAPLLDSPRQSKPQTQKPSS